MMVAAGAIFILSPVIILIGAFIYLFSLLITRYLFLSTFFSTIAVILISLVVASHAMLWLVTITIGLMILFRQKKHWQRYRRGLEPPYHWRKPFS
jgi:glycerol-3-phosphate acyltransferase PlsY